MSSSSDLAPRSAWRGPFCAGRLPNWRSAPANGDSPVMSKQERAIELRDLALTVVRAHGSWQSLGNKLRLLTYNSDDSRIALQTPFQLLPSHVPPLAKYLAAQRGMPSPVN